MKREIVGLVQFPIDAQRNSFFGALSSIILYRDGYTEETPFYCGRNQSICVCCGGCGNKTFMQKQHLQMYQHLITITGSAYFWEDKAIGDVYEKEYVQGDFSEKALDRLSMSLKVCGYHYESFQNMEEDVLFDKIRQSIDNSRPVLIKLGGGDVWAVITGYDMDKKAPLLMKHHHGPKFYKEWYDKLTNIVFITDKYESSVTFSEALNHMVQHLDTKSREKLEQKIYQKLETEQDGRKLGMWLNKMNGLVIENRWHASSCYRNTLAPMVENHECKELLLKASDLHLHFHDQAWKIWKLLGVSPKTCYCLPGNVNELLDDANVRTELKNLYQELFLLDKEVNSLLKGCLTQ